MEIRDTENIRTVDRTTLRRLDSVKIDTSLPCEQRVRSFIEQIGNPYCYLDGDIVVSLGFSNNGLCLKDQLKALATSIS